MKQLPQLNEQLRQAVESIIRQAGKLAVSYYHSGTTKRIKEQAGIVTEADLACEQLLTDKLKAVLPDAGVIGEENGSLACEQSDYCWVIDPIDGTTNFVQGLPHFCISVGLTYRGQPVFGMVYQPLLDELFYAQKGSGAFLNGRPISVSATRDFSESMLIVCMPYVRDERFDKIITLFCDVTKKVQGTRKLHAAAIDLCYVAAGRVDGLFSGALSWWDVCAAIVIVQEAGGIISDFSGASLNVQVPNLIAGNPTIHAQLMKEVKGF